MKLKRSEADVKRAVETLLKARGLLCFRMNSGDHFGSYKGRTWRIRGNPSGTADLLCLITHHEKDWEPWHPEPAYIVRVLWIEAKSSEGIQSPAQIQFQEMVEKEGHSYLLVRSAAEVEAWLIMNT